ncbi:MAG: hypothetical protein NC925_04075 [Candidatus Omnitrophica bacterium]|nr:hypothetical protein [Candidatus Omnitrophota bacterium]MCM8831864.1 hypothetical protein [Candidatus Omnitrophota bacterium]
MESKVLKIVTRKFNFYRAPECKAKVISQNNGIVKVEFSGTKASFACCFDENFIDYQYYLKDYGGKDFSIRKIERKNPERFIIFYEEVKNV